MEADPCPICDGEGHKRAVGGFVVAWRQTYAGPAGHWVRYEGRRYRSEDVCYDCYLRWFDHGEQEPKSPKRQAFEALAGGYTQAEAGEMVGVTRQTINVWVAAERKNLHPSQF